MSDFLYERFLEDHRVYHAARAFWFRQMKNIHANHDQLPSYLSERFANGKLFYDGNPIFNAINPKTGKAIRIVQESPRDFGVFYTSFLSESLHQVRINDRLQPILERVIVLTLTRESLKKSTQEVREWLA